MCQSFLRLVLLLVLFTCRLFDPTHAQPRDRRLDLSLGDAVVTGFSGTAALPNSVRSSGGPSVDLTFINPEGASARLVGLARPGFVWDGRLWQAPKPFDVLAKDVGQVFGVALDDQPAPNIYLAATSAFGLNIVGRTRDGTPERRKIGGPGAGWMRGQFGLDMQGDPGSIYKVDGTTGVVSLFAKVMLDGVPNPGPALGNLAYDPAYRQLFVSDLYTGMIHRFATADGSEAGPPYDHGAAGRRAANLAPVSFNPANRPNISSNRFNAEDPGTWGFAPPERRVWGLAVQNGRLFYSVGNGGTTQGPQIWSVGIQQDGGFAADARIEIDVPAQPGPYSVSDIAFSQNGAMILAQRGPLAASYEYSSFTRPGEPRVLRYRPDRSAGSGAPSRWIALPDEYAIGLAGSYRNGNGGVALGYGYAADGTLDTRACEAALWATGQNLRNNPARRGELEAGGPLLVDGLQGSPADAVRSGNEPPTASYFVDYDDAFDSARASGQLGSIRIFARPCPAPAPSNTIAANATPASGSAGGGSNPPFCTPTCVCPPGTTLVENQCVKTRPVDLGINKDGGTSPPPNVPWYAWHLTVTNVDSAINSNGVITVTDVAPAGMTFTGVTSTPPSAWTCGPPSVPPGGTLTCTYNGGAVTPGQVLPTIDITAQAIGSGPFPPFTNCATVGITDPNYSDGNPGNDQSCKTVTKPGTCPPPMVPGAMAGQCVCPSGTVQNGNQCVTPSGCQPPMVPGAMPGQCVCPSGTVQNGNQCVTPNGCQPPMVPGAVPGQCVCPQGTRQRGNTCVPVDGCSPPMVPGPAPGVCICPPGTVQDGKTCVAAPNSCPPPMIPGATPKSCVCPQGTIKRGSRCVPVPEQPKRESKSDQPACREPAKLNRRGACACPAGMTMKGSSCVAVERKSPRQEILVDPTRIPGVRIPGIGIGGGGGGPRGGGGGGSPVRR